MLKNKYYFFVLIVLTLIFFPLFFSKAVEIKGLKIDPAYPDPEIKNSDVYFIFNLDKGETKEDGVKVTNTSDEEIKVKFYPSDAVVSKQGTFVPLVEGAPRKEIGAWIEFSLSEATLEPKEEKIIPFTITVPKDAAVGDHLGAVIVVKEEPPLIEKEGEITRKITKRLGIEVYETVPGEIKKILKISDISWKIKFKKLSPEPTIEERIKTILGLRKDGVFLFELKNEGNVHLSPKTNIEIFNVFGQQVVFLENISLRITQPGGTTFIPVKWENPFLSGRYTVKIDVFFEDNQKISTKISFWIVPWAIIGVVILLVIIFVFIKFFWRLLYLILKLKRED